ncbi:MAG: 50S ribosomal protein L17 [Flavobacteriales bacterium]|nr:50S ribosomal protein L17 [Flavobacteriales bacterium]
MRHGNKNNALGRKKAHRGALLSNLAVALIEHKRIETTLAKAKALRTYVEPLLTKSKADSTHSRRVVFSHLQDKEATASLFRDVAPKIAERAGGYTRIIKLGNRLGDAAEMAMIELVDFNTIYVKEKAGAEAKKTRRSRRSTGGAKAKAADAAPEEVKPEAPAEGGEEEAKSE